MRLFSHAIVAAALLAGTATANASVLFSDSFNVATSSLAVTSRAGCTITGNVDLVAQSNGYGIGMCVSGCLDLDGTTGPGAILSDPIAFTAGKPVIVGFDLSGNQRGGADDAFVAKVFFTPANGGSAAPISGPGGFTSIGFINMLNGTPYLETIASGRSFLTYSYQFSANVPGTFRLYFGTTSADNIGPILDNVLVSQVPEPASWAMLITGFGLVGFAARRRRAAIAA